MSKETFKRFLIHQDDELLVQIISDLKHYSPKLNQLKAAYEGLEFEDKEFDFKAFEQIRNEGVKQVVDLYLKNLNEGLESTGVKNQKLREFVLSGSEVPIGNIQRAYNELKYFYVPEPPVPYGKNPRMTKLSLEHIDFIDGAFKVGKDAQENILEAYCRIYIEDQEQEQIYNNLLSLKESLTQWDQWVTKLGLTRSFYGGNYTDQLEHFFSFNRDTREISIVPSSIRWGQQYDKAAKARQKAEQERQERNSQAYQNSLKKGGF
ncbi:hypothetical protein [Pedobacter cryotolerans]|uniref:Uncharacterized protein n=1 Tax=Pedobacter cryotolerans TaxID=2571270 RepID=A0A4U1C5M3_9SPHI|nr:hypothetical protein [Pedobacter cryotolerans]TKC01232.1 hypothetical protein FA045_08280 [Pedobacter cryotolerans]